jgi:sulfate transport system substrate-binding protein
MFRRVVIVGGAALVLAAGVALSSVAPAQGTKPVTLLNVSYDPTRELYQDVNAAFAAEWQARHGQAVTINQSHGGSPPVTISGRGWRRSPHGTPRSSRP